MERQALEDLWRTRLKDAELRLYFARNYVAEVHRDFPLTDTSSDGQYAYQRALRMENLALAQYTRVLRLYTDLVMRGQIPDKDEWLKTAGASR